MKQSKRFLVCGKIGQKKKGDCDEMELLSIIGLAVVSTVFCILLKQYKPEYALMVSLVCSVLIFVSIVVSLKPVLTTMNEMLQRTSAGYYGKTLLKALGICYLVQLASDSCKDAGQTAIAGRVELAGKAAIVLLSLPLFQNLAEIALGLIYV